MLILASVLIGIIASLLGIGGGVFLIPILTLGFGIDIKVAAATSLVTIIVTSSTSASRYLKGGLVNVNLGIFLELFAVLGGIVGAIVAFYLQDYVIEAVFGAVLIYTAFYIWKTRDAESRCRPDTGKESGEDRSRFRGRFYDECQKEAFEYDVRRIGPGAGASFVAGNLSGLIGVGGGIVNVPAMNLMMGVPMKAAVSTSNFIIGVTAVASALVYLSNGLMAPAIIAAASIGIFIGAMIGTRLLVRAKGETLRTVFAVTILIISALMFSRAGGWL
ncbi:MAG: sulfite exporter TauE/SafE family protein [Thermoplasmata archaeon]